MKKYPYYIYNDRGPNLSFLSCVYRIDLGYELKTPDYLIKIKSPSKIEIALGPQYRFISLSDFYTEETILKDMSTPGSRIIPEPEVGLMM